MASFVIEGGHRLSGEIHPQGAKNEVLQIICATLLTAEEVTVDNIPDILDVNNLIQLMREMGVTVAKKSIHIHSRQDISTWITWKAMNSLKNAPASAVP